MDNQITELIKATPNILGQIYEDLAQPSVKAVGNALGTVFEFSTSILLPVKLLNERFKLNFTKNINDYKLKLEDIPIEKQCEVHPQIGTPIIEKLTYTTNETIADLFTTLLVNASNVDMVKTAHPSFVSLIERLSPDEARIIKYLKDKNEIQYCNFKGYKTDNYGFVTIKDHLTLIPSEVELEYPENINAYLANLVSLGILLDMNGTKIVDKTIYDKIIQEYKLEELKSILIPNTLKDIKVKNSFYEITDFGKLFIKACIK